MKLHSILITILLLSLTMYGCRDKKTPSIPKEREIFPGVIDSSAKELKKGVRGGTIIRSDIQDYDTFNVVTTRSRSLYSVLKLVFESLLSLNPITGEIQGGIAKEYEIKNDGYSVVLHLNDDVYFSDGTLCTADDVVHTFEEVYMNPDVDSKKTDVLKIRDKMISINKLNMNSIQFDLPVPYRPFLFTLAHIEILPKHIIEPIIANEGIEAFNREWGNMKDESTDVVGTGPYYIAEYRRGELIRLSRNPYYEKREGSLYVEGMPYLDEIIELLDIDDETKILKFQIGEIDFYDVKDTDISSGDLENLINNSAEGNYRIYSAGHTLGSNHFLVINQNPKVIEKEKLSVFQSVLFRRAISHLIDRKRIVAEVYKGYAWLDSSPERSPSPFYKNMQPLSYDIQAAQQLLAQLQLNDRDGNGFLDLPSGKPFELTILTNEDNPLRVKMGELISESLNKAGIRTMFRTSEYDRIVTKLLETFDWEAVIIGVEGSIEPNDASWIWESKGPLHLWAPYMERPQTEWEKRIDELFALGRTTWDISKAKSFYHEYQDIIARELPVITILIPPALYGFRNDFGNIIPSAVTHNALELLPFIYRKDRSPE